jgi:hypothetical protein
MSTFFGWFGSKGLRPSQGEVSAADVSRASRNTRRYQDAIRLLTDPQTDEERELVRQLERVWLASREQGC